MQVLVEPMCVQLRWSFEHRVLDLETIPMHDELYGAVEVPFDGSPRNLAIALCKVCITRAEFGIWNHNGVKHGRAWHKAAVVYVSTKWQIGRASCRERVKCR